MNDFFKWATSPYSGYQGGGSNAKVWFCGIEYGGNSTVESLKRAYSQKLESFPSENKTECELSLKYSYNKNILKIVKAYDPTLEENDLFSKSSPIAKLNLFPVSFKTDYGNIIDESVADFIGF